MYISFNVQDINGMDGSEKERVIYTVYAYIYVYISLVLLLNFYQILYIAYLSTVGLLYSALGINGNTSPYSNQALIVPGL